MKRRATAILLGIMVSSMFLSACGKNEAKEAANESAQVEEEGVGEVTEEGEKVEAENKNASDADDSSKAGDSAKSDEDNKETSVKEEEDGDSSGKDSDDESEEDAEVTEASAGKIGVLLSDDDEDAKIDSEEMTSQIEDGGYEADVKNAGGDPALQISQIQEFIDEKVSALIIDPVDSYGLTDILKTAKEQEIPVISYDSLIRDTADINYYVTYDTRAIGKDIAKEIIKKMDLDKAREDKKSYTIEFLMGSPDDNAALFLCNGIQEGLQEYLDDGTLVCKSGNTSFDDTGIMRWSETSAKTKLDSIISEFYAEEKAPDIICTAYDGFAYAAEEILNDSGLEPGSDEWPMITGYGSEAQAVKDIAAGKMSFTMFMDRKELAKGGATGKKQIDRYTRYLAVVLSFFQASTLVYSFSTQYKTLLVNGSGWASILYVATLLTAGSMFILWIGDRISMKGIGNGVSMIIAAGIISRLPYQFTTAWQTLVDPSNSSATFNGILTFGLYIVSYLLIIVFVVFMQTAERKIPIQYTSSTVTTRKKDMTYLPLKINSASVIPVIFASAIMVAPLQICKMVWPAASWVKTLETYMGMQTPVSLVIYVVLILLFTFFYTKLQVDPEKIAENLGKSGTYIPGIRPGTETKEYVNKVLCRITVLGAIGLAFIAVLPHALPLIPGINLPQSMGIGGTGIIIVVGVAMETVKQIEGRLTQKSYRGFLQR